MTMGDKLIYISNSDVQNSMKVPKVVKPMNKKRIIKLRGLV